MKGNEKKYVNDCLDSSWISSKGAYVEKFESEFQKFHQVKHASTVSNGTVALHLSLLALGIGPGDEVIVPTLTYIASVNAISYTGAKPVFADSLKDTWQINPNDIKSKITSKTKAIMVVHLYGHACEMQQIVKIANENDLYVIEDCAEAFGSKYNNKLVGNFGHIATFSFFGNKTITTGEGGMVATNDAKLSEIMIHLKSQGLAKNREYWHDVVGYNYRMTNICAAIGLAQLEQATDFIEKKRKIASWYEQFLCDLPLTTHQENKNCFHTYWIVNILLNNKSNRESLRAFLSKHGIETRPMFYPIHTMPIYKRKNEIHPIAEDLGLRGISLPSYPELKKSDVEIICKIVSNFFQK